MLEGYICFSNISKFYFIFGYKYICIKLTFHSSVHLPDDSVGSRNKSAGVWSYLRLLFTGFNQLYLAAFCPFSSVFPLLFFKRKGNCFFFCAAHAGRMVTIETHEAL